MGKDNCGCEAEISYGPSDVAVLLSDNCRFPAVVAQLKMVCDEISLHSVRSGLYKEALDLNAYEAVSVFGSMFRTADDTIRHLKAENLTLRNGAVIADEKREKLEQERDALAAEVAALKAHHESLLNEQ